MAGCWLADLVAPHSRASGIGVVRAAAARVGPLAKPPLDVLGLEFVAVLHSLPRGAKQPIGACLERVGEPQDSAPDGVEHVRHDEKPPSTVAGMAASLADLGVRRAKLPGSSLFAFTSNKSGPCSRSSWKSNPRSSLPGSPAKTYRRFVDTQLDSLASG